MKWESRRECIGVAHRSPKLTPRLRLKRKWTRLLRFAVGMHAAALRAMLVANAYLEAEVKRLTEAISTGFARGRIRKSSTKFSR